MRQGGCKHCSQQRNHERTAQYVRSQENTSFLYVIIVRLLTMYSLSMICAWQPKRRLRLPTAIAEVQRRTEGEWVPSFVFRLPSNSGHFYVSLY
jgi:hypothetical protein